MNKQHKVSKTKDRRLVENLSTIAKSIKRTYFYMSDKCLNAIIARVPHDIESVLVVDDAGLQVVRRLYDLGIKDVTLTFYTYDIKDIFDNFVYIINNTFRDLNVKLVSFEEAVKMKFDLIISNPPYGRIGAQITKKIIDDVDYKDFINLEPGNDYFIDNNYKYIDENAEVSVCTNAFEDAATSPSIICLRKYKNNLTQTQARLLLTVSSSDKDIKQALSQVFLNVEKVGSLTFTRRSLVYSDSWFIFNSGGFDICHGYFAVAKGKNWTSSTNYNIFKQDVKTASGSPSAEINGCLQFKKLVYSEIGLKLLKLFFTASPEGWGFGGKLGAGMFANIDYSNCLTWNDVFNKLSVGEEDQKILIDAANKFDLTDKEKEICEIVKRIL